MLASLNQNPKNQGKEMENTPNMQKPAEMEPEKSIAVREIEKWIERVSQVRPELGGFSVCPYAKSGKYKIIECKTDEIDVEDGYDVLSTSLTSQI